MIGWLEARFLDAVILLVEGVVWIAEVLEERRNGSGS